jgi:XRE family aerobic/anaerobic benzoate catabolism transcriptional regulator
LIRINAMSCAVGKLTASQALSVANHKMRSPGSSDFDTQALSPDGDLRQDRESEFLGLLGDRVREMRALCRMSRRELARQSGISERYVAQIEAGKGNVSIVLLLRIAYAIRRAQDAAA